MIHSLQFTSIYRLTCELILQRYYKDMTRHSTHYTHAEGEYIMESMLVHVTSILPAIKFIPRCWFQRGYLQAGLQEESTPDMDIKV